MFDLHTHSTHSDGILIPAEVARSAEIKGYKGIALTDHADASNITSIIKNALAFKDVFNKSAPHFRVIIGVELTHINPNDIAPLTKMARENGADIVVVHGETISEPVYEGTNRAAIDAKVDILAHPGLISIEDVKLAAENGIYLEITTRKSHAYTNGHVAKLSKKYGAKLVIDNDAHAPEDFTSLDKSNRIMLGAGLSEEDIKNIRDNNRKLFSKLLKEANNG